MKSFINSDITAFDKYMRTNEKLGEGISKHVYVGFDIIYGKKIAWGSIKIPMDEFGRKEIINEIEIMKKISGKNKYIIKLIDVFYNEFNAELISITEYANTGSLHDYITTYGQLHETTTKIWGKQILKGLVFLHNNNIIHRDLKPKNIFINDGKIIIGDFGSSKETKDKTTTFVGTLIFMAPEFYSQEYDNKIDIWAFGLCLIQMITGEIPYWEYINVVMFISAQVKKPESLKKVKQVILKKIIKLCLNKSPIKRPTSNHLITLEFFNDIVTERINDIDIQEIKKQLLPETQTYSKQKITSIGYENIYNNKKSCDYILPKEQRSQFNEKFNNYQKSNSNDNSKSNSKSNSKNNSKENLSNSPRITGTHNKKRSLSTPEKVSKQHIQQNSTFNEIKKNNSNQNIKHISSKISNRSLKLNESEQK